MSILTLEQLTTPLTVDEVRTSIYSVMSKVGITTTGWKPGAVVRTIVTGVAAVGSALSQVVAGLNSGRFIELAGEGWAEQVGHYDYGLDRDEADFATGQATLTNTAGGSYDYDPDDLLLINTARGKTYRNTEEIHLTPGTELAPTTATFGVRATEVGTASNALPGEIDALESALTGVTVTNSEAVVGTDDEPLSVYKERCLAEPDTNSTAGLDGAYLYWAKKAVREDGTSLGINRVNVIKNSDTCDVYVYCATAAVTVPPTDLDILDELFQRKVLPIPGKLHVYSAVDLQQAITYEAWIYKVSGLTTDSLRTLVSTSLTNFAAILPIGGHVYDDSGFGEVPLNSIESAIQQTREEMFKVLVSTPTGDLSLSYAQALSIGTVSGTIHWV